MHDDNITRSIARNYKEKSALQLKGKTQQKTNIKDVRF